MKLTILGSGTCIPTAKRNSPGYYLECTKTNILIDCGSGILRQLAIAKINILNLENIIISHFHPDHIGDLISILQSIKVSAGIKRKKTLNIYGPKGFKKVYKDIRKHLLPNQFENYQVNIHELKKINKIGKIKVTTQPVSHVKGIITLGLKFECDKKILTYTSDTAYDDSLISFAKNSNLLITDCAFSDQKRKPGHMVASECGQLAFESNSKKLVLSHIYPVAEKYDLKKQASKTFKGQIVVAKDFMKIKI